MSTPEQPDYGQDSPEQGQETFADDFEPFDLSEEEGSRHFDQAIHELKGLESRRVFVTGVGPGEVKFVDTEGDGVIFQPDNSEEPKTYAISDFANSIAGAEPSIRPSTDDAT